MYENQVMATSEKSLGGLSNLRQTLRERIQENKKVLEDHLKNLNEALAFLDKNPDFEAFHNIVGKAGF